jgi:hypothetical protein
MARRGSAFSAGATGFSASPTVVGGVRYGAYRGPQPPRLRGRLTLWAPELEVQLLTQNYARPQVQDERTGRWRTIDRPQLRPVATFDGYQALRIKLKLMLDGWPELRSVEQDVQLLRDMAQDKVSDAVKRPGKVMAIGAVPYPTVEWVIDTLSFDADLEMTLPSTGEVARAVAEVVLLEFVDPEINIKVDRRAAAAAKARTHTWTARDTLHALAKHYLGNSNRANSIRVANPKIKRWSTVKPGTKIKIPARTS